jgi:hypothetical protein
VSALADWVLDAACAGTDPRLFAGINKVLAAKAEAICNTACPVRRECAAFRATLDKATVGTWGGVTVLDPEFANQDRIAPNSKVCLACGRREPLNQFWRRATVGDGREAKCADCSRAIRARKRPARPGRGRGVNRTPVVVAEHLKTGRKPCTVCRQVKPLSAFWRRKAAADGRMSACSVCLYEANRARIEAAA